MASTLIYRIGIQLLNKATATSETENVKSRPRLSNAKLKNLLGELRVGLKKSSIAKPYFKLLQGSDFLKVVNRSEQLDSEQIAQDALVLLVVCVANECDDSSERRTWLEEVTKVATPLIRSQLDLLQLLGPEVWSTAKAVCRAAMPFALRDGMDLCEQLLFSLDRNVRKTVGAYFTPKAVTDRLVDSVDSKLKNSFGLPEGLASVRPLEGTGSPAEQFVKILDPAAGCGAFLQAVLAKIVTNSEGEDCLNGNDLVQRIRAIELHPAVAAVCHFRLFNAYASLGLKVESTIPVYCADALAMELEKLEKLLGGVSIVLGNPPFGALSTNANEWIDGLMKGKVDGVSYFEIAGEKVKEKKSWLHDDYVKFSGWPNF